MTMIGIMIKYIIIIFDKIIFLLSNPSIRYFEILCNTGGDFEFINAMILKTTYNGVQMLVE